MYAMFFEALPEGGWFRPRVCKDGDLMAEAARQYPSRIILIALHETSAAANEQKRRFIKGMTPLPANLEGRVVVSLKKNTLVTKTTIRRALANHASSEENTTQQEGASTNLP